MTLEDALALAVKLQGSKESCMTCQEQAISRLAQGVWILRRDAVLSQERIVCMLTRIRELEMELGALTSLAIARVPGPPPGTEPQRDPLLDPLLVFRDATIALKEFCKKEGLPIRIVINTTN